MGERSKVYMTDLRCRPGVSLLNKLEKLMRTAGIGEINFERKLVAIKMHFGEPGNLAFLRPNYAKVVADVVKSLGGVPFLTDCNTLYPGRRKNALEHLDAAYENGFSPLSTGCQVIIGRTTADATLLVRPRQNSIICGENFHRVVLVDTQGSAELLWNYQSSKMINTANNSSNFHKKAPPSSY